MQTQEVPHLFGGLDEWVAPAAAQGPMRENQAEIHRKPLPVLPRLQVLLNL